MKLLSKCQIEKLVSFSPQQIAHLESAGECIKPVKLSCNRVGWVEQEVLDWLQIGIDPRFQQV